MTSETQSEEQPVDPEITTTEVLGWLEFGSWTTLALAPFLYWVNGPAVSQDQFVVRTGLVCLATVGALGLTGRRWWGARRDKVKATQQ